MTPSLLCLYSALWERDGFLYAPRRRKDTFHSELAAICLERIMVGITHADSVSPVSGRAPKHQRRILLDHPRRIVLSVEVAL